MAADKKPATDPAKAPPAKDTYAAQWNVRANGQDFAGGDDVTGLSEKQAAELLALGAIVKK